jgi:hypothetical protein
MRPVQPPRLKLRPARKGRNAIWVKKTESAKSAQALAKASAAKLRSRSRITSSKTGNHFSATVIPMKS